MRIEADNVGIGFLRNRARGIRDAECFKLKIRQLHSAEKSSVYYKPAPRRLKRPEKSPLYWVIT